MSKGTCRYIIDYVPRRRRLRSLDLAEELGEHPDEVVVVRLTEDLGDEGASLGEKFDGEFEGHEHECALRVRGLDPCRSDIGSTVVQDDIGLPVLQLVADQVATVRGGDVGSEGDNTGDGLYGYQVDTCRGLGLGFASKGGGAYAPTITLFNGIYLLAT